MERDVARLIQREQHRSAVLVVARLARDRGRQAEQDREHDPVTRRVAFRDDDVDAGSGIAQFVEIDLPKAALALLVRDRLHHRHRVRRAQRREFRPQADEDPALGLFPVRFFEDAPLDPRFGVWRRLHLVVDLVEAARGDELGDHRGSGVVSYLRQVQEQGSHQRGFGLRPERIAVVMLVEVEAHDDGRDLVREFRVSSARGHEVPAVRHPRVGQVEAIDAPEMARGVFEKLAFRDPEKSPTRSSPNLWPST